MTITTTISDTTTLAARAAGLLSKASAYGVAEKALNQALAAKRVFPPLAADYGEQLGIELPLKTRDFTRVVGHLLSATEKPIKGIISKKKSDIIGILAELVGTLTDTPAVALPAWAVPKERTKKAEKSEAENEAASVGALDKANTLAAAEAAAEKAEKAADLRLSAAVALIVSRAGELTEEQRNMLAAALATTEPAPM